MWMQFHSSSSSTLATKFECGGGSVSILQLPWPQGVNAVVPFQFFNYFGLHFVVGKSNMIDCIFITLHKDLCGHLVLGGNTESICRYWRGCENCIPKDKMISFRPHTVSIDNIHFGPILRLQSWGMWWDLWGPIWM